MSKLVAKNLSRSEVLDGLEKRIVLVRCFSLVEWHDRDSRPKVQQDDAFLRIVRVSLCESSEVRWGRKWWDLWSWESSNVTMPSLPCMMKDPRGYQMDPPWSRTHDWNSNWRSRIVYCLYFRTKTNIIRQPAAKRVINGRLWQQEVLL